jgi:hypothetical protein
VRVERDSAVKEKILLNPPLGATFEVNSEPHTGACPSVRLCVGLIKFSFPKRFKNQPSTSPVIFSRWRHYDAIITLGGADESTHMFKTEKWICAALVYSCFWFVF